MCSLRYPCIILTNMFLFKLSIRGKICRNLEAKKQFYIEFSQILQLIFINIQITLNLWMAFF